MTLRKLIDEFGVAYMALYRYFAGKEDLIKEVLEQRQSFVVSSTAEKLGLMPDAITRLKGVFDRCGTWLRTPEFTGCLFERALAELGDTWPETIDITMHYRDDLLAVMEMLSEGVVSANTARQFTGVCVIQLAGVAASTHAIGDPSAVSQVWYVTETLPHQARAAMEAV